MNGRELTASWRNPDGERTASLRRAIPSGAAPPTHAQRLMTEGEASYRRAASLMESPKSISRTTWRLNSPLNLRLCLPMGKAPFGGLPRSRFPIL